MSGFSLGSDFTAGGWNCGLAGMPWGFWGLSWALTCPHGSHTHGFSIWPLRGLVWASSQDGSWFQEQASQERKVELHNSLFNLRNHTTSFLPQGQDIWWEECQDQPCCMKVTWKEKYCLPFWKIPSAIMSQILKIYFHNVISCVISQWYNESNLKNILL